MYYSYAAMVAMSELLDASYIQVAGGALTLFGVPLHEAVAMNAEMEIVHERGFDELGLWQRSRDAQDRLVGEENRSFRHGMRVPVKRTGQDSR
jgi:hypothetical protein